MDASTSRFAFVRDHPVMTFFVITYLIGYIAALPLFLTKISVLGLIAASSSSLGGIVTAMLYGRRDVKRLFGSLIHFRISGASYLAALLLPPTLVVGAMLVNMLFGHPIPVHVFKNWQLILPTFAFLLIQAGLGEELGWRGFALPHLVKKVRPLTAALLIGVVWAFWHLALYFFPGTEQADLTKALGFGMTFACYSTFVVAFSVILSWLTLRSRNSLVPAILMHGMVNVCGWYFNYNDTQAYGGATMLIAFTVLWVVAAVLVCVISPVFRTPGAALSSSRLPQPVVGEAAE
jgi:membrane protease YdiL (CAAX protease family)